MDTTDPLIRFDEKGICQYCHVHDELERAYPLNNVGRKKLNEIVEKIKKKGRGKKYDCVIGVSGGTDSTYQLYLAKKLGLRPLVIHLDNGWDSEIATSNIRNATKRLGFDLQTYVIDWEEFKKIQIAFLRASTPDSEIPTDEAIKSILYRVAAQERIKYLINGHSFRTEGKVPVMWSYGDGLYIKSVCRRFGNIKIKTFPNFTLYDFIKYAFVYRIKQIRLLYYFPYQKGEVKKMLSEELKWQDYGGHHYESIYTRFLQGYILPKKFKIDKRKREFSALIRSGQMTRDEALRRIQDEPPLNLNLAASDKDYVIKKLGLTEQEFDAIMSESKKTFLEYPNYLRFIIRFRKPIRFLYRFVSPNSPPLLDENLIKGLKK